MQARLKFLRQRGIDLPLPFDPRDPRESRGDDINLEMGLAFGPGAGVTVVARALVLDAQILGRENLRQGRLHALRSRHRRSSRGVDFNVKRYVFLFFTRPPP
jgi:hypothetical protein